MVRCVIGYFFRSARVAVHGVHWPTTNVAADDAMRARLVAHCHGQSAHRPNSSRDLGLGGAANAADSYCERLPRLIRVVVHRFDAMHAICRPGMVVRQSVHAQRRMAGRVKLL